MIYKFITDEDILQQIKGDLLADIIQDVAERQKKIGKAESAVLTQIKSKAGKWYKMEAVLIKVLQWNDSKIYAVGEYVYDEGMIYVCMAAGSNQKPNMSESSWKMDDPRHELLVMYAVDMILYHLHSSINPRKIPEIRKERYSEAKAWLEMVAERNESPDFPESDTDEELIIWGSNPKQENYY